MWLALPLELRYHTPAADLYRRRLAAEIAGDTELPTELAPIRPPPPLIPAHGRGTSQLTEAQILAQKNTDACELCGCATRALSFYLQPPAPALAAAATALISAATSRSLTHPAARYLHAVQPPPPLPQVRPVRVRRLLTRGVREADWRRARAALQAVRAHAGTAD